MSAALLDSSNISSIQPVALSDPSQDWATCSAYQLDLSNQGELLLPDQYDLTVSDLRRAFQNHKGLVVHCTDKIDLYLPATEDMLNMFKSMVNRPLVVGDVFLLNIATMSNVEDPVQMNGNDLNTNVIDYWGDYFTFGELRFVVSNNDRIVVNLMSLSMINT